MSTQHTAGKVDVLVTCKRCYLAKTRSLINISHRHPTTPTVLLNGQQHQNAVTPVIKTQIKPLNQQLPSSNIRDNASGVKPLTPDSNVASKSKQKTLSWGVIWRKKNLEDTGVAFRHQNVLLAAQCDQRNLEPACSLCKLPYNPGLTYIHCTSCDSKKNLLFSDIEAYISSVPPFCSYKSNPSICMQSGTTSKRLSSRSRKFLKLSGSSVANAVVYDHQIALTWILNSWNRSR